jgi:hypothetical protein
VNDISFYIDISKLNIFNKELFLRVALSKVPPKKPKLVKLAQLTAKATCDLDKLLNLILNHLETLEVGVFIENRRECIDFVSLLFWNNMMVF